MSASILDDATVQKIAAAHGRTPAQIIQAWEWSLSIPTNPRSANPAHMRENLSYFDIQLTDVRAATKEEIDHGHVHGPGGHHHH